MPRGSSAASGKAAPTAKVLVPAVVPGVKGRTKLGEGAVWSDGRLLWLDIIKGKIFTTNADSTTAHCDTRQMVGTVVPVAGTQTRVVAATHRGICVVELSTGRIERYLGNPEGEQPENTWNDGKCDPAGRLWVGSKNLHCDKPTGALWSVDGSATWTRHVEGVGVSNGLVWTRDRKTFYYIDSPTRTIDAFDYDMKAGTISNRRVAVRVKDGDGYPDGCAIDDEDKVWVAMWEGGCVIRYDPKSGKEMMRVAIPGAKQVTSCAFGGADHSTLYVTTASAGIPQAEIDREQPNAGALFAIDLKKRGVSGVPASAFKLPKQPKKRARGV